MDSSAIISVLRGEPDAPELLSVMLGAQTVRISAGTYLEMGIVVDRLRDPVLSRRLDELLHAVGAEIVGVTEDHAKVARQAYRDFGKGMGHPASLNFGDCFSYALAISLRDELLFEGNDFSQTDVVAARTV